MSRTAHAHIQFRLTGQRKTFTIPDGAVKEPAKRVWVTRVRLQKQTKLQAVALKRIISCFEWQDKNSTFMIRVYVYNIHNITHIYTNAWLRTMYVCVHVI